MVWEFVFLMVVLKIPIIYLCAVVYWAIRAEPRPPEAAALVPHAGSPDPPAGWTPREARSRVRRPHGSPSRGYRPGGRSSVARAHGRR